MSNHYAINRLKGLNILSEALKHLNIKFSILDGALLGFIRDKKLIEWDWDAEIALFYVEYKDNLIDIIEKLNQLKIGKLILSPSTRNPKLTIVASKSDFGDFKYAITPFKLSKNKKVIYRDLYKYPSKYLNNLKFIKIDKYSFPIPQDAEELLNLQYGENWTTPIKSTIKNEYLSKSVYTKSNNLLNQKFIYFLQVNSKIKNKFNYLLKSLINNFPGIEYKLKMHREQLFIYQLLWLIKNNKNPHLIEIGSSDLSEFKTLYSITKKNNFNTTIYEATKSTYETI